MKNILLVGQFTDNSGYGNAVRSYFTTLKELHDSSKIQLKILNCSFERVCTLDQKMVETIRSFSLLSTFSDTRIDFYSDKDLYDLENYVGNNDFELIFFLTNDWLSTGINSDELIIAGRQINYNLLAKKASKVFPCVVWETDTVPTSVLLAYEKLDNIDGLICACEWNSKVFTSQTGIPSYVIPYVVENKNKFDSDYYAKLLNIKKNNFTFCSVSQMSWRKGNDIMLRSFFLEFPDEEVTLILKTYVNRAIHGQDESRTLVDYVQRIKDSIRQTELDNGSDFKCKVVLVNELLTEEKINSIYKASDCYVTCTRGEGFGLPIAEFILSAKRPVIIPDKGGHLDFCDASNYFIESRLEPYFQEYKMHHSMYTSNMNVVECSVNSTRKEMRKAFNDFVQDKANFIEKGLKSCENTAIILGVKNNIKLFEKVLDLE